MMVDINKISNALTFITNNSMLWIEQVKYDEKYFGNIWINLRLSKEIDIIFIRDKGDFWCEIGRDKETFLLEDVCNVLGIKDTIECSEFIDMIYLTSYIIIKYSAKIQEGFNDKNFKTTQKKVSEYATNRALRKFNL